MQFNKWLRKHKTKIMTVVLIVIMITFVGGYSLQQILMSRHPSKKPIATYDGGKIRGMDVGFALTELEILRELNATQFLMGSGSLPAALLGQTLFGDSTYAPYIYSQLKTMVMRGQLPVDMDLVDSYFQGSEANSGILWILLNYEADQAGCAVSRVEAIEFYKQLAKAMGTDASEVVAQLSTKHNVSQEAIMEIFAKLLSVITYSEVVSANSDVTLPEIKATIGFEKEAINATYVKFDASKFSKDIEINQEKLAELFETYKDKVAGKVTEDNPYGFGYKLPSRVQVEYMILKLDDVANTIEEPTSEEMEKFYQANKASFTEEIASDPADPESEKTTRQKTYSEAVSEIRQKILTERRDVKAEKILSDTKDIVDSKLMNKDVEEMSGDEIAEFAGDYAAAAKQVSEDYGIEIFTNKTGYLSIDEFGSDMQLGMLSKEQSGKAPIMLPDLVFAVQGLGDVKLGVFDGKAPKKYETISSLKGRYTNSVAMVRVVDIKEAQTPDSIDMEFDITGAQLRETPRKETYKVKDKVEEDFKTLSAMYIAREKAEDFVKTAGDDWDKAVEDYNAKEENSAKISVGKMEERKRMSAYYMNSLKAQSKLMPSRAKYLSYSINNKYLMDEFHSLAIEDKQMPTVLDFEPEKSVYAVKSVSLTPATTEDYDSLKAQVAAAKENITMVESALINYNAKNILARTGFESLQKEEPKEEGSEE